jgi:pimeloyl-ACP methyl ester carboxylesterase
MGSAVGEAEPPRTPASYVVGAGGVRLFYRVDGGGPDTLVVLHGGPGLNLARQANPRRHRSPNGGRPSRVGPARLERATSCTGGKYPVLATSGA